MADKVLITGATGKLGPVLMKQLQEKGYECFAFVLPGDPLIKNIEKVKPNIVEGNLADYASIRKAVKGMDYIIHMGTIQSNIEKTDDPSFYYDVNYRSTFLLLWAVVAECPKLKRFLYTSSCASYSSDNPRYLPIDEEHIQRPYDFYGPSKVTNEAVVRSFGLRYGIPYALPRFTTIFVPEQVINYNKPEPIYTAMKKEGQTQGLTMYEELKGLKEPWVAVEKEIKAIQKERAISTLSRLTEKATPGCGTSPMSAIPPPV
jgi:nucleoside-diphosphate-sugar epimerase